MNYILYILIAVSLTACFNPRSGYLGYSDRAIEYPLSGNQYAVVVAMDGISAAQAKRIARQRAAEIVVGQGDRYFTIDSEQRTQVAKSDDDFSNQRFHGNLYQELIIEGDWRSQSPSRSKSYSAIRLVFTSYKKKPSWMAVDACTLTRCR